MPILKFEVQADYEKVIRLREEIQRLDHLLKTLPIGTPSATIHNIEKDLATARGEFRQLTSAAAMAGAEMEDGFKKRIYDASQSVNDFTEKIIAQKEKVRTMSAELRRMGDELKGIAKDATGKDWFKKQHLIENYNELKQSLEEQKDSLFSLTQEQATARLSVKRLRDEYALVKKEAGDSSEVFNDMKEQLMGMSKDILGTLGVGFGIKKFVGQMVQVRGEFQQIETSLEVLLGSKEKAAKLMGEVKEFAKVSPLDLKSTAAAAQMMLGFNIEAEKVPRFLQAIGDVSMGNAQRFNSLTLAFSQMSATGKLMGQDLNQMINAGFNPLSVMAEKTGKSIATLKEEMSKGAITSEMVQQAFIDATSAGGKFYQMSERASKNIEGQISMMQDALDSMFNSLGEQSEGVILGAIETTTSLIENYETVGKVLAGLVAVYGTYKAAVLITIAAEQIRNGALLTSIKATKAATVAQAALNKVMMANPYALAAAAIVGVVAALWALEDSASAVEKETERLSNRIKEQTDAIDKQRESVDKLISTVNNETESDQKRQEALDELKKTMPEVFAKYMTFIDLVEESSEALSKETNAIYARNEALNKRQNYNDDIEREKELKELVNLSRAARKGHLSDSTRARMETLKTKYDISNGIFESVLDKAEAMLSATQESLKSQAGELRDKSAAAWDVELSKTTTTGQVAEMTSKAQKYIDAAKSAGKEYVTIDGVPIPVSEFERRVKAGNARAKLIMENANKDFLTEAKKSWDAAAKKVASIKKSRNDRSVYADEASYRSALQEAQKEEEKAKAAYKSLGGDPTGKTAKAAEKEADNRLKAEQKASDELLALKRQTQQSEIDILREGTDKKLKQIGLDYQKQLDAIKKQERAFKEQNVKSGVTGLSDGLTKEQSDALSAQREAAKVAHDRQTADAYGQDLAYMRDYLKEYGTFQQRKLAIAEEYNQKIANSTNEWERKSLAKQRDAEVSRLDIESLKAQIDWGSLFGDFGTMFRDQLQPTIDKLRAVADSESMKSSSIEEQKALYELIAKLEQSTTAWDNKIFTKIASDLANYQDTMAKIYKERETSEIALTKISEAKERLEASRAAGDSKAIMDAEVSLKGWSEILSQSENAIENLNSSITVTTTSLNTLSANAVNQFNLLETGLNGLFSGNLKGIGEGFMSLEKLFNDGKTPVMDTVGGVLVKGLTSLLGKDSPASKAITDVLGATGMGGQIISAALGILDLLSQGIENVVASLLDTVLGAVDGLLSSFLSLDIPLTIGKSLRDGIGNILDTLVDAFTLGHISSINWNNSNAKEVEKTISRLTDRNEKLIAAISDLTDIMKTQSIAQAVSTYEQARANQEEINRNYLDIARAQAGYHGSHNSWNKEWRGFDSGQMDYIRQNVKSDFNGDIFSLTPEEMKALLANVGIRESIGNTGKGGYGLRLLEKLEDYAEQAGKLDELTTNIQETLTGMTFDSLRDSFRSSLMDMDKDAKDFANDLSRYLMESVLDAKLKESLDGELEAWYEQWAKDTESGEGLDKKEAENLNKWWNSIVEQGLHLRDEAAAITGYTSSSSYSQEATKGVYEGLSQDVGMEMNGRMTAIQDGVGRLEALAIERNEILRSGSAADVPEDLSIAQLTNETLKLLLERQGEEYTVHSDTRRILAESYVELQQIRQNTGDIVKPIKRMNEQLDTIAENLQKAL